MYEVRYYQNGREYSITMTYDKAWKIIAARQYYKCNIFEKRQMDMAIEFVNNPANMPKDTIARQWYELKKAFKQDIINPIVRMFDTIFKYINEII